MKKTLSFLTLSLIFGISVAKAQTLAGTGFPGPCEPYSTNCSVSGWAPNYHYISTQSTMGPNYPWVDGNLPAPPSETTFWAGTTGKRVFMSIYSEYYGSKSVDTEIKGLVPGKTYKLKYYIMSSRCKFPHRKSGYGTIGKLTTQGMISGYSQTFTPGINTNKWIQKELIFKAQSSTQILTFRNYTEDKLGGVINLDMKGSEWLTEVGATNAKLSSEWLADEAKVSGQDFKLLNAPTVYPNPASGILNFNIKDWNNVKNIELVNATGNVVYKSASKPQPTINIERLPKGTYSAIITAADGSVTNHRIVVIK
jgi:hypothetical protein